MNDKLFIQSMPQGAPLFYSNNPSDKKWLIGSIVELIDNSLMSARLGAKAIIREVRRDTLFIEWDRKDINWNKQCDGEYRMSRFAIYINLLPNDKSEPKNNDGRANCFWCNFKTEKVVGFTSTYDICQRCGK